MASLALCPDTHRRGLVDIPHHIIFIFIYYFYLFIFLFIFLFLLLSFIFIFIFIIIIMGSVRGVPGGGGRKRLVFAPVTGSASGVLLYGQIPDFFDIWACNRIGIRRTVVGANELLFEILRQCPGREAARERFWALKIQSQYRNPEQGPPTVQKSRNKSHF